MIEINYLALIASSVLAFLASGIWYFIFAKQREQLSGIKNERPQPWVMILELFKNALLGVGLLELANRLAITSWMSTAHLALFLWILFPALILLSSVMHEKVPFKLASIHAGDWLVKLLLIAEILVLWR